MSNIEVTGDLKPLLSLDRQIEFAAATALTAAAQESRAESVDEIEGAFHNRSDWYRPGRPSGVRITPATRARLESEVKGPGFLAKHERGGRHTSERGGLLAVPTANVRTGPGGAIPRSRRPGHVPGAFVLGTAKGPVLFERAPSGLRALYGLESSVLIDKRSVIYEPTRRVVEERFDEIFGAKLKVALETAK